MANGNRPGYALGSPAPVTTAPPANGLTTQPSTPHVTPHGNSADPTGGPPGAASLTPQQVRSMQQFLVNHGFQVAQDGVFGPQTKAAALAFRTNHKGGAAWSKSNGTGVHPGTPGTQPHGAYVPPVPAAGGGGSTTTTPGSTVPGTGVDATGAINGLLKQLLGEGGNVGLFSNPSQIGNAAAAPQTAVAAALARQVAANPKQEAQNQADISNWYGLDPNDPNYKLSVEGRLATAKARDQAAATGAATNDSALAQALAGSVGGSANDGSAQIAAAGENAAGTANALGTVASQYADDMNPLLAAEARGKAVDEKGTNSKALQALQDSLAAAKGQATADRSAATGAAVTANNGIEQQRFSNKGNLVSVLAQMQAADPNSKALSDALKVADINNVNARTARVISGKTGAGKTYKIDVGKVQQAVITQLGYGSDGAGHPVVPTGDHTRLATTIGAYLRSQGFRPGDGQFKKLGDAILGGFVDQHGRPIGPGPGWAV